MSLKKYSFLSIFCYGLIFISPLILASIGLVKSTSELITATAVMYILGAVVLAIFYFKQREPLAIESAVKKASVPKIVIYGLVGIFVALILQSIAVMLESVLFGEATPSENTQNIIQMIMEAPAFILATTVAGPIMEEFVFRRSILGIISRYSNFWVGAVISSLLFAFAHNDGHLLIYFFLGFFFSLEYKATGRIWTSMITHVGMNTLVVLVQLAVQKGLV
ncbi:MULTISPECIES: CPBP family intramembrane glutamic endopeptidase [Enterococcus]|uniref:CPBP family intramembrane metalloprotease n=1 Tax=Enterococcus faecium TaxID=1352 RepID=A0A7V7KSR6_ENTFC|nr:MULTISPECIES: type II CAAX endopeptidase family protein [Enterococcus]EME7219982.1 CPBP family intramembrane metalloprotease [Enterococcus faecium]EME8110887.1 CPBP family intramembrane metalloprotease [Enterococcus faecium]EME8123997.1 CPBP family intramembrane metalloprotease [Enterococcus faecium]KAA0691140.1 CPBP family intramembrane metalloprotease [Enterococcus faecium]MBK5027972.1 CPBP family intramembrane metalloprotease [Enterococcus faecium]